MDSSRPLVVVGDVLLDRDIDGEATRLVPDAPAPVVEVTADRSRPGGAGLAACLAARAAGGRPVVLVTALGSDRASAVVRETLASRVTLLELPLNGALPVKTRIRVGGRTVARVDHGGGEVGPAGGEALSALREAHAVLVADYGRGTAGMLREELARVAPHAQVTWDPHPRGSVPVPGVRLATPNAGEARALCGDRAHTADAAGAGDQDAAAAGNVLSAPGQHGGELLRRWNCAAVTVTLGGRGALLTRAGEGTPMYFPAPQRSEGDPCGAGDCFAATAAAALAHGALPEEATQEAVARAAAFVAAGGAGDASLWEPSPAPHEPALQPRGPTDARALAASVRAGGGTVVATGGCFDLLHAGHVGLLQNARRTGDCLIVCVNSDASVARLKGPGRPLTAEDDRVAVLAGLDCVDAVAVFDEETPRTLLRELRPHLWVKGGDYGASQLPETETLNEWGGQTLVLPYLDGRSTTELARRAAAQAPGMVRRG